MPILPLQLDQVGVDIDGTRLLDDITLTIEAGPRTVILGPNGAGKSLLLRLCHGLVGPSMGTVRWCGNEARQARRRQAMVFQKPVMLRRSLRANVLYGLKLQGFPTGRRQQRAAEALERTGLASRADQRAVSLSAGEQQRLALARAWALAPEILFLDEPTASLDPGATAAVEAIVNQIHGAGTKIVMTTHDLGQAKRLADEVIFLQGGKVAERTAAPAFFERPESEAGRAFLGGELMW
ncbi:MAG: ATP-binding cassette domain-containing protein [Pseudomonadota bacterium]